MEIHRTREREAVRRPFQKKQLRRGLSVTKALNRPSQKLGQKLGREEA
jgi:hypothetical protein